jgi:hypothetical protein
MPAETRFDVVAGTGVFDFTPAFEDAVLGIVPSALFLVVALQRLFWLARQPRKVAKNHRPIVKVARDNIRPRNNRYSLGLCPQEKTTTDCFSNCRD